MLDSILNLLFPVSCVLCGSQVLERKWAAACPHCWGTLVGVPLPFCLQCGAPATSIEGRCGLCRKGENIFDFARSALLFNDPLRRIVHHLKYSGRVSLARPLGDILRDCLDRESFSGELVIPVPLHSARRRERGYNQAELITRRLGRPCSTRALRRRKNTGSQTGLTRSQRRRNLAGAFDVAARLPSTVIVVDDVYTTGSTVNEIARTLKRAGVERVEVLTVARVEKDLYPAREGNEASTNSAGPASRTQ